MKIEPHRFFLLMFVSAKCSMIVLHVFLIRSSLSTIRYNYCTNRNYQKWYDSHIKENNEEVRGSDFEMKTRLFNKCKEFLLHQFNNQNPYLRENFDLLQIINNTTIICMDRVMNDGKIMKRLDEMSPIDKISIKNDFSNCPLLTGKYCNALGAVGHLSLILRSKTFKYYLQKGISLYGLDISNCIRSFFSQNLEDSCLRAFEMSVFEAFLFDLYQPMKKEDMNIPPNEDCKDLFDVFICKSKFPKKENLESKFLPEYYSEINFDNFIIRDYE